MGIRTDHGHSIASGAVIAGAAIYFLLQLLIAFYHMGGGDEGTWLYHAYLVSHGYWPVFDFMTQHPIGSSLPYAAIFHLLPPSWEAGRLLSTVFCFGSTILASMVVWRHHGPRFGLLTFLILALNVIYQSRAVQVYSMTPMTFGLTASFFCLVYPARAGLGHFILAGLFLGFAGAARLPALALGLMIAIFALCQTDRPWSRRLLHVVAAALAALIPLIPEIRTLAADPSVYFYQRWTSTSEVVKSKLVMWGMELNQTPGGWLLVVIRGWGHHLTLGGFYAPFQNSWVTLLLAGTGTLLIATRRAARGMGLSSTTLWSLSFCLANMLAGSVGWLLISSGSYLSFTYPFLAASAGCLAGDLWRRLDRRRRRLVNIAAVVLLVPYSAMGIAHGIWQLTFRNNGGFTQPTTIAAAACWLREASHPDQPILSAWPGALVMAQRMEPRGMEAAGVLKDWYGLGEDHAGRLGILPLSQVAPLLRSGTVPIILDDNVKDIFEREIFGNIWSEAEANYTAAGIIGGGAFPLKVYVHHSVDPATLPPLPSMDVTQANMDFLKHHGLKTFLVMAIREFGHSLATLPHDVGASVGRLTGRHPCPPTSTPAGRDR